jgi:predicted dehydrogenase
MTDQGFSRRRFFFGALLAGAVPAGGFGSTPSLTRLGYKSPNEKLNLAAIGAGGRATANIAGCAPTENMVAFADPDDNSVAETYKRYEKAAKYRDFRRMLDKEGGTIDAVIITTPDHTHAVAANWCMERGKHVYLEKPLTRTIWEARFLSEAAAKYKVATQMGNQGYSFEGARIAAEIIWSGEIGAVKEVHCWTDRPIWDQGIATLPPEEPVPETLDWDIWLGPAALRPFSSAYVPFKWRAWYDFGSGALGDIACHVLGAVNIALRLAGSDCTVEVVRKEGKNPYTFAKKAVTEFQFPALGARAPLKIVWTDAADGPPWRPDIPKNEPLIGGLGAFGGNGVLSPGGPGTAGPSAGPRPAAARPMTGMYARMRPGSDSSGAIFVGEKGYLTADNYGANIRLLPLSRHYDYQLPAQFLTRSPGHYRDWIRACKGGEPACSNFSVAGPFSEIVQLAALASRFEGKLEWDSGKMKVTNRPEANEYLKPNFRKGWEIG